MSTYEITSLPAITLLGYAGTVTHQSEIPDVVGPLFGRLLDTMRQLGLDLDQPTVAWYAGADERTDLGVGLPSDRVLDDRRANLTRTSLDAAPRAVVVRHTGSLEGISPAWSALHQHIREEGLTPAGPCREVYLAGSMDRPDSWVVDLQQPIA